MLDLSVSSKQNSYPIKRMPISVSRQIPGPTSVTLAGLTQDTIKFSGVNEIQKDAAVGTAGKWIERSKKKKTPLEQGIWEIANNIHSIATQNGPPYISTKKYRFYSDRRDLIGSSTQALCVTSTNTSAVIEELARAPSGHSKSKDADRVLQYAEEELKRLGFNKIYVSPKTDKVRQIFVTKYGYHENGPEAPLVKDV
jgi:hypothetical protein